MTWFQMPLWGLVMTVPDPCPPTAPLQVRVLELSSTVRQVLLHVGMQGKALADAMGLSESHLSRQMNEQGLNLGRLLNAGRPFWMVFLPLLTRLAGLTRDDAMTAFGVETDSEREQKDRQRDAEIALLKAQMAEVLARLPPVVVVTDATDKVA